MKHHSAADAERAFYRAFSSGDAEVMTEIWARTDDVVCIHPGRAAVRGRGPVLASWQGILSETSRFRIEHKLRDRYAEGPLAVHLGTETVEVAGHKTMLTVTNVFRKDDDGWYLVMHHAAPLNEGADSGQTVH